MKSTERRTDFSPSIWPADHNNSKCSMFHRWFTQIPSETQKTQSYWRLEKKTYGMHSLYWNASRLRPAFRIQTNNRAGSKKREQYERMKFGIAELSICRIQIPYASLATHDFGAASQLGVFIGGKTTFVIRYVSLLLHVNCEKCISIVNSSL